MTIIQVNKVTNIVDDKVYTGNTTDMLLRRMAG